MSTWSEEEVTAAVSVYTSLQFFAILFKVVNASVLSDEKKKRRGFALELCASCAFEKRHNFQNVGLQLTSSV